MPRSYNSKGGITSHAAVTAGSMGKVCIVNCKELIVNEVEKFCTINEKVLNQETDYL